MPKKETEPKPKTAPKFKRRRYIVNPKFQWRFIGFVMLTVVGICGLFFFAIKHNFQKDKELGLVTGLPQDHVYFEHLGLMQSDLTYAFLAVCSILLLVVFLVTLAFSFRVAGPVYRMTQDLLSQKEDNLLNPIQFREYDYFPELADAFNRRLLYMHDLARRSPELLIELLSGRQDASNSEPDDGSESSDLAPD